MPSSRYLRLLVVCSLAFTFWTTPGRAFDHQSSLLLQGSEPPSLHPLNIEGYDAVALQFYILEPLLRRDEQTYQWIPALATRWEVDEENRTYTFWLREGVRWSDGKPFTAEDVKFSFDAIFSGQFKTFHTRPYLEGLSKVEILSSHQVRFHAKNPYFMNFFAAAGLLVIPKHIYQPKKPLIDGNRELLGTGPYLFTKWAPGKYIHMKKNPEWWGHSAPEYQNMFRAENVVFRFIGNSFTALEMLKKGSLDYITLDYQLYQKSLTTKQDGFVVHRVKNSTPKSVPYMGFNLKHPILKERYIREALSLLLDRKAIVEKIFQGQFQPAAGPWYNESPFTPSDSANHVDPFSPKAALEVLKKNGWRDRNRDGVLEKGGRKLEFTILFGDTSPMSLLTMFQSDAAKVGVKINLKQIDWTVINQRLKVSDFEALYTDWGPGPIEFDPKTFWHSEATYKKGGLNFMGYKNAEVDKLMEQMLVTSDFDKRKPLYHRAYQLIKRDLPAMFFFYPKYEYYATSPRVGQLASTLEYDLGIKTWWIKTAGGPR